MKNFLPILLLIAALGCRNEQTASNAPPPAPEATAQAALTPEQLGTLGAKIRKDPNRAEQILAEHNMTAESFEQAVRKVTEDPAASKRYAVAFRNEV